MFSQTLSMLFLLTVAGCQFAQPHAEDDFKRLFDGQSLKGWQLVAPKGGGYGVTNLVENGVTNAVIYCAKGGGGNLLSEKTYSDFVLRFDFKLTEGANNGLAIRAPNQAGNLAYDGLELQILDAGYKGKLKPEQFHGSVYNVAAAKQGALKPAGEWNSQEVIARGRRITVRLNGTQILDVDINSITDPATLVKHPGLFRPGGHIGFLGHNDEVFFKNIRIKELVKVDLSNVPPKGFRTLFNGTNLAGWQGLAARPNNNPIKRAALTSDQRRTVQAEADANMTAHWKAETGTIIFDGHGRSLQSTRDYRDFEMLVDWKITAKGDSGIYLRGTPQVQMWDPRGDDNPRAAKGSGGLYNNQSEGNAKDPIVNADHIVGDWNRFRILMIDERVHVFLNGRLVVKNTILENLWDRTQPPFREGAIELQAHGSPLWFKNLYIREIQ